MPVVHYTIDAYGFRVQGDRLLAYSGDSGPCDELEELAPRRRPLPLRGDPRARGPRRAGCAGTSQPTRLATPVARAGARRLLLTHRPQELQLDASLELAHDGLALEF